MSVKWTILDVNTNVLTPGGLLNVAATKGTSLVKMAGIAQVCDDYG